MDPYLLAVYQACINATNKLMLHSATRDFATKGHLDEFGVAHDRSIARLRDHKTMITQHSPTSDAIYNSIFRSIKFSTGNCGEFALVCGLLLYFVSTKDQYLFNKFIRIYEGELVPGDHVFCVVEERLALVPTIQMRRTIVDAWGNKIMLWNKYEYYARHTISPYFEPNSQIHQRTDLGARFHASESLYLTIFQQYRIFELLNEEIGALLHQPDYRLTP